jgi:uncharacterized protein (TIGR02391 family)
MSNSLSLPDKAFLEGVLGMGGGYVLDFSNASFETFFAELNIGIYDDVRYPNDGLSGSKANRLRAFWKSATNEDLASSLNALAGYVEAKKEVPVIWGDPAFPNITAEHLTRVRKIAKNLGSHKTLKTDSVVMNVQVHQAAVTTEATVTDNKIQIEIHEDVYNHIRQYLENKDYFHAVEESYKLVRAKLKEITGKEKAHEAFSEANYEKIFGHRPQDDIEKDFFDGVKFLNMSIQFLRNEKAHTPATQLEENLAIHYISLASLAYDLITRYISPETIQKVEEALSRKRLAYKDADSFYADFKDGEWLKDFVSPVKMTTTLRGALKEKWINEANFAVSYNHTNIDLMRLELVAERLLSGDIDKLLRLPTKDAYGNEQGAGILEFLQYVQLKHPDKISHMAGGLIRSKELG